MLNIQFNVHEKLKQFNKGIISVLSVIERQHA